MSHRILAGACVALAAQLTFADPFPRIPLDMHNATVYRINGSQDARLTVMSGTRDVYGTPTYMVADALGNMKFYTSDASGWQFHGSFIPQFDVGTRAEMFASPPVLYGAGTLQLGQTLVRSGTITTILSGATYTSFDLAFTSRSTATGWETVTVPGGVFRALRLSYSFAASGGGTTDNATATYWIANNVGLVKAIDNANGVTTTEELVSINFPVGWRLPPGNDLLIDFGPQYGIWLRRNDSAWVGVHSVSAQHMASGDLDNNGIADALIDFGPQYGIWARRNGSSWSQIHGASAQEIVATDLDNNGQTDFVINFGSQHGLWAYMNDGTWKGLHSVAPRQVVSAQLDADPRRDLVVDFGPQYGIWLYMNDSTWVGLNGVSAQNIVAGDLNNTGIDDLVIDFGPAHGIWMHTDRQAWGRIHSALSRHMVAGHFDTTTNKSVVIDFGPQYGIWKYNFWYGWSGIHNSGAQAMIAADVDKSGIDDLVVSFGDTLGLWQWKNGSTWEGLHAVAPQRLIATDFDGQ